MIKKTVSYNDYNGKPVTEDLYFHLKVDALTNNLHLGERLEKLQETFAGDKRDLTTAEKQEVLDVVKLFINLSYGVRVDGGAKFRQRPELLDDFRDSAAYDAFLWALFQDPSGAMSFMADVMPENLIAEARKVQEASGVKRPQDHQQKQTPALSSVPTVSDSQPEEFDDADVEDDNDGDHEESIEELEARLTRMREAQLASQPEG